MKEVFFAMTGSVKRNSRALKQLRILSENGFRVQVVDLDNLPDLPYPDIEGISYKSLRVGGRGPGFFRAWSRRIAQEAKGIQADIFHASDLFVLTALSKASVKKNARLVYDSRELYPFVASTKEKPWSSLFWRWVESKAIPRTDLIFTVSDSIADTLRDAYNIERPTILFNIPEAQDIPKGEVLRKKLGLDPSENVILHQGRMAKSRGCFQLVDAFQEIENAHCVFLGGGPLKSQLQTEVSKLNLEDRVHFLDSVPNERLLSFTKDATIGVSLLEDSCLNHRFALPNKLFEYLNASLPVLVSELPEMSKIVENYDIGRTVDSKSSHAIARAINSMLANPAQLNQMSLNTSKFRSEMNWEDSANKFRKAYASLFSDNPA